MIAAISGLHANGQSSQETLKAAKEFSQALSMPTDVLLGWGEVLLQSREQPPAFRLHALDTEPAAVSMSRVHAVSSVIRRVCEGRLAPAAAAAAMERAGSSAASSVR